MVRTACSPPTGCHRCGGQLSGRRKAWCSKACNDAHLNDHYWGWARTEALRRASHACQDCGNNAWEVHHIVPLVGTYGVWTCQHHQTNLRVLCQKCHLRVHAQIRAYIAEVTRGCSTASGRDQARLASWVNAEGIVA